MSWGDRLRREVLEEFATAARTRGAKSHSPDPNDEAPEKKVQAPRVPRNRRIVIRRTS